jgi:hypothetical protein
MSKRMDTTDVRWAGDIGFSDYPSPVVNTDMVSGLPFHSRCRWYFIRLANGKETPVVKVLVRINPPTTRMKGFVEWADIRFVPYVPYEGAELKTDMFLYAKACFMAGRWMESCTKEEYRVADGIGNESTGYRTAQCTRCGCSELQ